MTAACRMKVGEWANPGGMYRDRRGKMMMPAARARMLGRIRTFGTVAKLAMRQPFVLFKGLTFQKLCLP
ncbi:hypothetical protein OSL25_23420, partial [Escherichia coli]|nr:hypothetical protein [Escherichia coli]